MYTGSADGYFYALNAKTGALLWRYDTGQGGIANSTVTLGNGLVYFESSGNDTLYAVSTTTGALAWSYTSPQGMTPVAYASRHLYFTSNGYMTELSAVTGHVQWSTSFGIGGQYSASVPLVSGGSVYGWDMLGSATGVVGAFNATSGAPEWTDPGSWFSLELTLANGTLFGAYNNEVVAMDPASGAAQWTIPSTWYVQNAAGGLEGADGVLFYIGSNGQLAAASTANGTQLWTEPASDPSPVDGWTVADGQLLFGSSDGNMHDFKVPATAR